MFIPRICQTLYLSTHLPNKQINKIANKITRIWKTRQDRGCLGLVHCDDPVGWDGEGGRRFLTSCFLLCCSVNSRPSSQWCHPTISFSVIPSSHFQSFPNQGLFNESVLHIRWPKHWSFSFSISPSNKYSGQISFSIDCCDLLAVQGTNTIVQKHQLFGTQLSL